MDARQASESGRDGARGRVLTLLVFTDCPDVAARPVTARFVRHRAGVELRRAR